MVRTSKLKQNERYYLSQDTSCHWYVIPLSKRKQWDEFLSLDEDDPKSWEVPEWAESVGGSYTLVTFTDPVIG